MFKRNTVPQRKPCSFSKEQIIEDIKTISENEDERNKLFLCLEEKPPQDHKFSKLEEFLKGTNNLEDISETLADLVHDVDELKKQIKESIEDLKTKASTVNMIQE
ncbi:hypothetical protein NQ314_013249 [Rhamnusium bicolor]|uniref:Uncharacterized protein n=1 Tax=Rhamnusium bicolor TaxID=1586634 RepID=A0AAV8X858_9CUCU|nr:hypothetical protein NQ314_013249 [Rhamnusium bicolor]